MSTSGKLRRQQQERNGAQRRSVVSSEPPQLSRFGAALIRRLAESRD